MPAYYLEILVLVLGFTMLGWESFSSSRSRAGIANLGVAGLLIACLLYTSPSPRDATLSRMPSSA